MFMTSGRVSRAWRNSACAARQARRSNLKFGEALNPDGTLYQDKIKIRTHQEDFQTDRYTLECGGPESWRPRFTYHGFQYVQVTGFPGTSTLKSLRALAMNAAFDSDGRNSIEQANRQTRTFL